MSLLADIGGLTGSNFLTSIGNTPLGQKYSDKILTSVNKKLTPKPAPQMVAAPAPTLPEISVSMPDQGTMKKIMMAVGGVVGILVVVYLVKKGR